MSKTEWSQWASLQASHCDVPQGSIRIRSLLVLVFLLLVLGFCVAQAADVNRESAHNATDNAARDIPASTPSFPAHNTAFPSVTAVSNASSAHEVDSLNKKREAAVLLFREGQEDLGLEVMRSLHTSHPHDKQVTFDYVTLLSWSGKHKEAVALSAGLAGQQAPDYAIGAAAASHRHLGKYSEARALYVHGLRQHPTSDDLFAGLVMTFADENNLDEAEALLKGYPSSRVNKPGSAVAEASQYVQERRALRQQKAVESDLANVAALSQSGQTANALNMAEKLYSQYPNDPLVLYDYVALLSWQGKHKKALEHGKKIDLTKAPQYVIDALGVSARRTGKKQDALQIYQQGVSRYPDNFELVKGLAFVLADSGRVPEAMDVLAGSKGSLVAEAVTEKKAAVRSVKGVYATRREALKKAQAGEYVTSLALLEQAAARAPKNTELVRDYATVMDWMHEQGRIAALQADNTTLTTSAGPQEKDVRQKAKTLQRAKAAYIRQVTEPSSHNSAVQKLPPVMQLPDKNDQYVYERALQLARMGKYTDALAIFKQLFDKYPKNKTLLGDYMTALNWARSDRAVLPLLRDIESEPVGIPSYSINDLKTSLTHQRQFYLVDRLLRDVIARYGKDESVRVETALLFERLGQNFRGLFLLPHGSSDSKAVEDARRVLNEPQATMLLDLLKVGKQMKRRPDDHSLRLQRAKALRAVKAPERTWEKYATLEGSQSMNTQEMELAKYAQRVRFGGEIPLSRDLPGKLAILRDALDKIEGMLSRFDAESAFGLKIRLNRAYALCALNRLEEALQEYETLVAKGVDVPTDIEFAMADAYLSSRQPQKASALYERLAHRDLPPKHKTILEAKNGQFWSYLEGEQLKQALAQAITNFSSAPHPQPKSLFNQYMWHKQSAYATLGLAYTFTGFVKEGAVLLGELLEKTPASNETRINYATNLDIRGLPRTSLEELEIVKTFLSHDFLDFNLEKQRFASLMSSQQWEKAEATLDQLLLYEPYNPDIKHVKRRWETHNMFELQVYSSWAYSDGKKQRNIDHEHESGVEFILYSPPIAYNWRAFGGFEFASGKFPEGRANQKLLLGGLDYRSKSLTATVTATASDMRNNSEAGIGVIGEVHFDDHWSVPFALENNSRSAPLRALYSGITADRAMLGVKYFWDTYRSFDINAEYMKFSDDNERIEVGAELKQRLYTWYTHSIDGSLYGDFSANSKDGERPYFNPKSAISAGARLAYSDVLWRNYDKHLNHTLKGQVGSYTQKNHGTGVVWSLDYGHELALSDRLTFEYGVGTGRNIYDGRSEYEQYGYLNMVVNF